MSANRVLILLGLLASIPATTQAQQRVNSPVAAPERTAAAVPEFPLVVRIDDSALDPLREKDIRKQGAVDRV
ncbi:MAG: hypothetical protein IAF94_21940, partial [Pirellulaceae bacterium]|nr:hypothetical protein [Pirellulaceae bacterium]